MSFIFKRVLAKIRSNLVLGIINAISVAILPRALGPSNYGSLHFIRNSFTGIFGIIDLNGTEAHFIYSSKNEKTKYVNFFHTYYCFIVGSLALLFLSVMVLTNSVYVLFPGQKIEYLFWGALLTFLFYLVTNLTNLSDSKELTVGLENRRIRVSLFGLFILIVFYFTDLINLRIVFGYFIFVNLMLIIVFIKYLNSNRVYNFRFDKLQMSQIKKIFKYYYNYSHPLVLASILSFIILYFDSWFLQLIGGSIEQGFFGLALRVSSVCILITSAMIPVFQQSVAKAHGQGSLSIIQTLFQKVNLFYFISICISTFFFFNTKDILYLFGGNEYSNALVPLKIMMLYPIHQTYGRFTDGLMLAMGKTKTFRNISVFNSCLGLVISYLLIAPNFFIIPGLALGATGLAIKMVLGQIISANIRLYYCCRIIKKSFSVYFFKQVTSLTVILGIGYVVNNIIYYQSESILGSIISLIVSAPIYSLIFLLILWFFPNIAGLSKDELKLYIKKIRGQI